MPLSSSNLKYFNRAKLEAMAIRAKDVRIIGFRGVGKSEGFDSVGVVDNVFSMHRSVGAIIYPK